MTLIVDHAAKRSPTAPVPVCVNGVVIPRDAITREIQNHAAPNPALAWRQAAQALVVRELLLQEAARLGLKAQPRTDSRERRETDEEALLRQLVEQEVTIPVPNEEECRRYYSNNSKRFRSADIYEAAHILFAAPNDDAVAVAEARQRTEAVLAELKRRPGLFAELASMHSDCPSGEQGGNLGQITTGQTTPEFEAALVGLTPGAMTETAVASRYGFHIIRLDRKVDGRQLPYELVSGHIAAYLKESVERRATAQYMARLVSRATITGIDIAGAQAHRVN